MNFNVDIEVFHDVVYIVQHVLGTIDYDEDYNVCKRFSTLEEALDYADEMKWSVLDILYMED